MSQSIRPSRGVAIRAVAAASLFASKPKGEDSEKSGADKPEATDPRMPPPRAGLKPAPTR